MYCIFTVTLPFSAEGIRRRNNACTIKVMTDFERSGDYSEKLKNFRYALAKNLYNSTLYQIRKYFFETKKYLSYKKLNKLSYELFPKDYTALPIKVSQQVEKLVDQNFCSFFALLRKKKQHPELDIQVNIPGYLDKVKGRQELTFTNQALSFNNRNTPKGYVRLSGVSFLIKTEVEKGAQRPKTTQTN